MRLVISGRRRVPAALLAAAALRILASGLAGAFLSSTDAHHHLVALALADESGHGKGKGSGGGNGNSEGNGGGNRSAGATGGRVGYCATEWERGRGSPPSDG